MSGHTRVTVPDSLTEPGNRRRRVGAVVEDVSHHLDCLPHGGCDVDRSITESATQDLAVPSVAEASLDENSNRLSSSCVIVKEVSRQYREHDEYPKEDSKEFSEKSSRRHVHPEESDRQRQYSQESSRQHGYSEEISKHEYSEEINKHGYFEEGSKHLHSKGGCKHEHSEEGSRQHECLEESGRHEHSEEGIRKHKYPEEGSRQHECLEESGTHEHSEEGSRQHEYNEEGSRQHEYPEEGSRHEHSEEGGKYEHSKEGSRKHEYSEEGSRQHEYCEEGSRHSEEGSRHEHSEEGNRHKHSEEGSRHEHSEEGSRHEHSEEGSRHEHSEEGSRHKHYNEGIRHEHSEEGSRHEHSEEGSRHEHSEEGSRHEHSEECSRQLEYPEEGSRHGHSEGSRHEHSGKGSRQHEYLEEGSRHERSEEGSRHEYSEECSTQCEYPEEGSRHEHSDESSRHEHSEECSRQYKYPEEGSSHEHSEEGSRQHKYPKEGSKQEIPEEGDGDHSGNNSSISGMDTLINPPDDELKQKVISLVEFYFSDESILKDAFLLKHVRRNRFGFVSLKLITSFKKMKALTRDYHVVAYCLKASEKLELNEESTKVRRKEPLPDYDETVPSRTVVALNLPLENPTMENMAEIFCKCGCVNNFRILRPGSSIPSDLHKFASKHPELESTMCAVVAFENYDQAQKACEILTNGDDWRKGMRVIPLMVPKKKEDKEKKDMKKKEGTGKDDISPEDYLADDKKRRRRGGRRKKACVGDLTQDSFTCSTESQGDSLSKFTVASANKYIDENVICMNMINPAGSSYSVQPVNAKPFLLDSHSCLIPQSSSEIVLQNANSSAGDSAPSGPWMQRRLRFSQEKQSGCNPHLGRRNPDVSVISRSTPRMLDMTNVLRQPRGPDDTKGFYGGMGRGKLCNFTIL